MCTRRRRFVAGRVLWFPGELSANEHRPNTTHTPTTGAPVPPPENASNYRSSCGWLWSRDAGLNCRSVDMRALAQHKAPPPPLPKVQHVKHDRTNSREHSAELQVAAAVLTLCQYWVCFWGVLRPPPPLPPSYANFKQNTHNTHSSQTLRTHAEDHVSPLFASENKIERCGHTHDTCQCGHTGVHVCVRVYGVVRRKLWPGCCMCTTVVMRLCCCRCLTCKPARRGVRPTFVGHYSSVSHASLYCAFAACSKSEREEEREDDKHTHTHM